MDRTPSGITGLDSLIEGGFPKGRNFFLSGSAGSGKTIFSCQFLYNGAYKYQEKGLYVSFEEPIDDIIFDVSRFGWDIQKMIDHDKLKFIYSPILKKDFEENVFDLLSTLVKQIKDNGYQRLVIDSLPAFGMAFDDYNKMRKELFLLLHEIRKLQCTTIVITEKPSGEIGLTHFGVEDFLAQGLIMLHLGHTYRGIEVRKLRGTNHSTDVHRMRVGEEGIVVYPGDHPY
jgi:circadian clock protein KaiC